MWIIGIRYYLEVYYNLVMGKRGQKPKGKIKIRWSANFAYAIGLLATDGCLSDGRHIILTSKDVEQLKNFSKCLLVDLKIGTKKNSTGQACSLVQFSDVLFYSFLESIGINKAKSLTLGKISIPDQYFFEFLRGCFDGDGCSYSYFDPRWKSSYMFYMEFCSASKKFIDWIRDEIKDRINIWGHITHAKRKSGYYQLKYAKKEALLLVRELYKNKKCIGLSRKKLKINESLSIIGMPQILI